MSVSRGLFINWAAQAEHFNYSGGAQVEVFFNELFDKLLVNFSRVVSFDANRNRISDADSIGKLNFALVSQARRDNIFSNVTSRISRAPVNFCGVFTAESSASMTRPTAVSVDDNFSAC